METEQHPITGSETPEDPSSPFAALVQFYRAFNGRDMAAMGENWERSAAIAMDNPLGGIKRGWEEISSVYLRIFGGPAKVYVEFYDYTVHVHGKVFYAVGRERGRFVRGGAEIGLTIRTTRIYRQTRKGWKQIHHHGSIDDPALLERYQRAVSPA